MHRRWRRRASRDLAKLVSAIRLDKIRTARFVADDDGPSGCAVCCHRGEEVALRGREKVG